MPDRAAFRGEAEEENHIIIERLRLPARLGVLSHEKKGAQTVCVSLAFGLPSRDCFESDAIGDTVDYAAVAERLRRMAVEKHYNLVEYLAGKMAEIVLYEFGASWVKLQCRKIDVVPGCRYVGVSILRRGLPRLAQAADLRLALQPAALHSEDAT